MNNNLSSLLSGVAGEYYVAAKLSSLNLIASITLRNTKGVDIICSSSDSLNTVSIQVKTNKGSAREWVLNRKSEDTVSKNHFYVFVCLNNNIKHPDYFVVPSEIVSKTINESHSNWLNSPGKNGAVHKDNNLRKFTDYDEKYLEQWNLLGLFHA